LSVEWELAAGGAAESQCGAAGRAARCWLAAGRAAESQCGAAGRSSRGSIRLGSSTVLASSGDSRSSVRSSVYQLVDR